MEWTSVFKMKRPADALVVDHWTEFQVEALNAVATLEGNGGGFTYAGAPRPSPLRCPSPLAPRPLVSSAQIVKYSEL